MQQTAPAPQSAPARLRTLGAALERRDANNFDFLRLLAALLVILSHSYYLTTVWPAEAGFKYYEPMRAVSGHDTFGTLAVRVFFIISGVLVARSFMQDPNLLSYARKRGLRILPGLAVAVLFCMFIVGPLCTSLSAGDYLASGRTWSFLINISLLPKLQYDLPGVFDANLVATVNGSLWSLPLEVMMYVGVVLLGGLALLRRRFILPMIIAAMVFHLAVTPLVDFRNLPMGNALQTWVPLAIEYSFFFFAGTGMLLWKEKIVLDRRIFLLCLGGFALSFQWVLVRLVPIEPAMAAKIGFVLYGVTLPYLILYLAFVPFPLARRVSAIGDLSYGTYLYGWPVQQMVLFYVGVISPLWLFVLASIGTLICAWASWRLVEKPALKFKRKTQRLAAPTLVQDPGPPSLAEPPLLSGVRSESVGG